MEPEAPCRNVQVKFGDDDGIEVRFYEDDYVVMTDVPTDEEVDRAVDELWTSTSLLGKDASIQRDDPSTWVKEHWPQQDGGKNFLVSLDPYSE